MLAADAGSTYAQPDLDAAQVGVESDLPTSRSSAHDVRLSGPAVQPFSLTVVFGLTNKAVVMAVARVQTGRAGLAQDALDANGTAPSLVDT